DYVRFASDGKIGLIRYPVYDEKESKLLTMKNFFSAVGDPLRAEGIPISFDVFGLICMTNDGLGIGQRLLDVLSTADFVSPMIYPSHFANGFQGLKNPAQYPYEVVKISLDHAILQSGTSTKKQYRPWIQDFDIGAIYTAEKIEAQIKAVRDAGASGFLIWNARNVYEPSQYVE
ncbi:MAG: putative glycoside hydrolase, partial [Patescibacteria group bacterium]